MKRKLTNKYPLNIGVCERCHCSIAPRETGVLKIAGRIYHCNHFPELNLAGLNEKVVAHFNRGAYGMIPNLDEALFYGWRQLVVEEDQIRYQDKTVLRERLINTFHKARTEIIQDEAEIINFDEQTFTYSRLLFFRLIGVNGNDIIYLKRLYRRFPKLLEIMYYAGGKSMNQPVNQSDTVIRFADRFALPFSVSKCVAVGRDPSYIPKKLPY